MRVFILEDPSITARQLLAGGYDVVIVTYEFVESNWRSMRNLTSDKERGQGRTKAQVDYHNPL